MHQKHWTSQIKKIAALVAIQGALRISEVVNIGYDDVTFLNNRSMSIRIKCSKTDQAGKNENQQPAERRRRIGFIKRRNCHLHKLFIREL